MLALIMAGGEGSRLNLGEKPLVTICGKPMIAHVAEAFSAGGNEVMVVASSKTPLTVNWCRARGIPFYRAGGNGYVADLIEVVSELEVDDPLFTCVSDLPCITTGIIDRVRKSYTAAATEACSVWVPRSICRECDCRAGYLEVVNGTEACPAGINILLGSRISAEQEELRLLLHERRLAFNINTREERDRVEEYLCPRSRESFSPPIHR
jgi:adenosylcobinamide-phosphate guanylyltransferase